MVPCTAAPTETAAATYSSDSSFPCSSLPHSRPLTLESATFVRQNWLLRRTRHTKRYVWRYIYIEGSRVCSFKKVRLQGEKLDLTQATGQWDIRGCEIIPRREGNYQFVWSVTAPVSNKTTTSSFSSCVPGGSSQLQPTSASSQSSGKKKKLACSSIPSSSADKEQIDEKVVANPGLPQHVTVEEVLFAAEDFWTAQEWVSLMRRIATYGSLYNFFLYEPCLNRSLYRGLPCYMWPFGWAPHNDAAAFVNDTSNSSVVEVVIYGAKGLLVPPDSHIYAVVEYQSSLFPCLLYQYHIFENGGYKRTAKKDKRIFTDAAFSPSPFPPNPPNSLSPPFFASSSSAAAASASATSSSSEPNPIQRWWARQIGQLHRPPSVMLNYLWNYAVRIPVIERRNEERLHIHLYTADDYYVGSTSIASYKFATQSPTVGWFHISPSDCLSTHPQRQSTKPLLPTSGPVKTVCNGKLCASVYFPRRIVSYLQPVKGTLDKASQSEAGSGLPMGELMGQLKRSGKLKEKINEFFQSVEDVFEFKCIPWSFFWLFYGCGGCIFFSQRLLVFIILPVLIGTLLSHPLAPNIVRRLILDFPIMCLFLHYKTVLRLFQNTNSNPYTLLECLVRSSRSTGTSSNGHQTSPTQLKTSSQSSSLSSSSSAGRKNKPQAAKTQEKDSNEKTSCNDRPEGLEKDENMIKQLVTYFRSSGNYYPLLVIFVRPKLVLKCAMHWLLVTAYGGLRDFALFSEESKVFCFNVKAIKSSPTVSQKNADEEEQNDEERMRSLKVKFYGEKRSDQPNDVAPDTVNAPFQTEKRAADFKYKKVEVWENERRHVTAGFSSKFLLPIERRKWSTADGNFAVQPSRRHEWRIEVNPSTDENGWSYAIHWGAFWSNSSAPWSLVRRRCWVSHIGSPASRRSPMGIQWSFLEKDTESSPVTNRNSNDGNINNAHSVFEDHAVPASGSESTSFAVAPQDAASSLHACTTASVPSVTSLFLPSVDRAPSSSLSSNIPSEMHTTRSCSRPNSPNQDIFPSTPELFFSIPQPPGQNASPSRRLPHIQETSCEVNPEGKATSHEDAQNLHLNDYPSSCLNSSSDVSPVNFASSINSSLRLPPLRPAPSPPPRSDSQITPGRVGIRKRNKNTAAPDTRGKSSNLSGLPYVNSRLPQRVAHFASNILNRKGGISSTYNMLSSAIKGNGEGKREGNLNKGKEEPGGETDSFGVEIETEAPQGLIDIQPEDESYFAAATKEHNRNDGTDSLTTQRNGSLSLSSAACNRSSGGVCNKDTCIHVTSDAAAGIAPPSAALSLLGPSSPVSMKQSPGRSSNEGNMRTDPSKPPACRDANSPPERNENATTVLLEGGNGYYRKASNTNMNNDEKPAVNSVQYKIDCNSSGIANNEGALTLHFGNSDSKSPSSRGPPPDVPKDGYSGEAQDVPVGASCDDRHPPPNHDVGACVYENYFSSPAFDSAANDKGVDESSSMTAAWVNYFMTDLMNFTAPLSMNAPDGISVAPMLLETNGSINEGTADRPFFPISQFEEKNDTKKGGKVGRGSSKTRRKNAPSGGLRSLWKGGLSKFRKKNEAVQQEETCESSQGETELEAKVGEVSSSNTNQRQGILSIYRSARSHAVKAVGILNEWNSWLEKIFNILSWKDGTLTMLAVGFLAVILIGTSLVDFRWFIIGRILLLFHRGHRRGSWKQICRDCAVGHIRHVLAELDINKPFTSFDSLESEKFRTRLQRRCRVAVPARLLQETMDDFELAEWIRMQRPEFSQLPKWIKNDWMSNFVSNSPTDVFSETLIGNMVATNDTQAYRRD